MTITIRVNGGEPIMVTPRTSAQLKVFNSMSQVLMPESPSTTEVHMLLAMLAREIEQAQDRTASVVQLRPRGEGPEAA